MKKKYFGATICVFVILFASLPTGADFIKDKDLQKTGGNLQNANGDPEATIIEAFEYARQTLFPLEGITGVSYTDDEPYRVIVYIESDDYRNIVPAVIKGYETDIRVTGEIKALGMEAVYDKLDLDTNTMRLSAEDMSDVYAMVEQFKQRDIMYYLVAKKTLNDATTITGDGYVVNLTMLASRMIQYEMKMIEKQPLKKIILKPLPLQKYDRDGPFKIRPMFGGISISLPWYIFLGLTAGTLGIVSNKGYILSNAHVMAMNRFCTFLWAGCAILQPGSIDGGMYFWGDIAGRLYDWGNIVFNDESWANGADCAIARVDWLVASYEPSKVLAQDDTNLYTVDLNDIYMPSVGGWVRKSGRTTGVTTGTVTDTHASVKVGYTALKWAYYENQIVVSQYQFSVPGDSGSIVDYNGKWVGLLFAGTSTITIVSPANNVLGKLMSGWR